MMNDVFFLFGITSCSGGCKVIQLHFGVNVGRVYKSKEAV